MSSPFLERSFSRRPLAGTTWSLDPEASEPVAHACSEQVTAWFEGRATPAEANSSIDEQGLTEHGIRPSS